MLAGPYTAFAHLHEKTEFGKPTWCAETTKFDKAYPVSRKD
jgi:hypothetical protein